MTETETETASAGVGDHSQCVRLGNFVAGRDGRSPAGAGPLDRKLTAP